MPSDKEMSKWLKSQMAQISSALLTVVHMVFKAMCTPSSDAALTKVHLTLKAGARQVHNL